MTLDPWRQEVVNAATVVSKSLHASLFYAGSMGTDSIGDEVVKESLETVFSLLSRGDVEWHGWFQGHISRPLAVLFADPRQGLLCKPLRVGYTKGEEKKRVAEIKAHADKLREPFSPILQALDFFIRDFPRGLVPPQGLLRKQEEVANFPVEWRKYQPGQSDKDKLRTVAEALEQVARWMKAGARGYRAKLRQLRDELDEGSGLPAHARAVDAIRERLESVEDQGGEVSVFMGAKVEAAERFVGIVSCIRHYCDARLVTPLQWEAPLQWPAEAREAAQRINKEIQRAVQFCATWTLNGVPGGHPCHESDCGQELWAMDWYRIPGHHSDKMNAKVHIEDGDRLRVKILVEANASATWRALEQVLGQVSAHSQEVDGHKWTRSHLDCADDDMPDFHGYAKRLEEFSISWRMRIDSLAITPNLAARKTSAAEAEKNASGIVAVLPSGDKNGRISDGRGEPLALPDLLRRANLHGPNAIRKPLARLLATLRSAPHTYQSVFILSEKRKGKAHADTKKRLIGLMALGLSEKEPDGTGWRLGERAFADKGEKKGETISR